MKDPQDMGYLLGKQYPVRIATAWSRAKQMLKEAKIDLIVANIDQADAGRGQALRTLRREHDVQVPAIIMAETITPQDVQLLKERERGRLRRLRRRLRSEADDGRRKGVELVLGH
jgi:CheY-like chemotaxis protein